ncbi:hypothetical protein [Streptomyces sp. NBC_00842]|uniref:hypothetical protein n=1 Tax=Streptomyces sp. NBC_00842 TaxID=2975848 RepID=UPI002F919BE5|nr:helix-turn-helix domain-containing protein [Streptomyces sp. NBC_00842]
MSGEAFDLDDGMDEVIPEEWPTFYTPVPVWVMLSGCSAQAYRMYGFLAEHINNRTPGKRIAFPSQKAIAKVMVLKDYRDVAKYRDELAELGAIRFEEFRYAGGMRRRYRYWVRFNPPEGYQGLLSLKAFYQANPDVKASRTESAKSAALQETAGGAGGGKNPTSGGGEIPTSRGGESPTAQQPDPVEPDLEELEAPLARSAPDARRASAGSKGSSSSGFAASGQAAQRLTPEQKQQVQAVRDLLPSDLNRALPVRTPRNIADDILKALAAGLPRERTPQQLVEFRVMARWNGYWAARFYAKELGRAPFGPLAAMVEDTQECGNGSCEDRVDIFTAEACSSCEQRAVDRRADREQPRPHPTVPEPAAPTMPRPRAADEAAPEVRRARCPECHRPLTNSAQDFLCRDCREDVTA